MFRRYFTAVLFALLFVFTQQAAIAHEISHVNDPISHSQKQDKTHISFCEKCASYSQLGNAVTSNFHSLLSKLLQSDFDRFSAKHSYLPFNLAYCAQAPPAHS